MTTNGIETPAAPVSNLRAARREQTQARKTAAKTAPAEKAPAKRATSGAQAKTQAAKSAPARLKWIFPEGYDKRGETGQTATAADGTEYAIQPSGEKWRAVAKRGGKTETLGDGVGFAKAYALCVAAAKKAAA